MNSLVSLSGHAPLPRTSSIMRKFVGVITEYDALVRGALEALHVCDVFATTVCGLSPD